ncbi:MAG: HprK-related kinase B [Gammaproteobacteria bacterium]|jgi:HprK-related kinase B
MLTTSQLDNVVDTLYGGATLCNQSLTLALGDCTLRVRSNSAPLVEQLCSYFSHVIETDKEPDIDIIAIERDAPQLDIVFKDWQREPGKTGRKDSYFDLPGARLVRKVRTGMVFLQSEHQRIAAGPCLRYDNQLINFINAQYMNWLQQRGWLICHAAGVVYKDKALGIAAFSGGGKSTLMLQVLDNPDINYLTNDRLFIKKHNGIIDAAGIPKLPRINPGTIVHNPRLHPLIDEEQRQDLLDMPADDLWQLEEKYDVIIDELYGQNRITARAPLTAFVVLNWQPQGNQPLQLQPVKLSERRDLLGAIMKSPGPFYQYADGGFFQDDTPLDDQAYLSLLENVAIFEASGTIDFTALTQRLNELMESTT